MLPETITMPTYEEYLNTPEEEVSEYLLLFTSAFASLVMYSGMEEEEVYGMLLDKLAIVVPQAMDYKVCAHE